MKYDARIKKLWMLTSREASRYSLDFVHIDVSLKVAVATDGHAMTVVDVESLLEPEDKDFDIPRDALRAAAKMASSTGLREFIRIRAIDGAVAVSMEGFKRSQIFDSQAGKFPKWDDVVPSEESLAKDYMLITTLDPELLSRVHEVVTAGGGYGVSIYANESTAAVVLVPVNSDHRSYSLAMPMRSSACAPQAFWRTKADDVAAEVVPKAAPIVAPAEPETIPAA